MKMKHEGFGSTSVSSLDGCEILRMSLSKGSESLSKSLTCPSMLQVVKSSVTIVCESLEDMASPLFFKIRCLFKFPSSNMSIAFLDSSIENQKRGYIKPDQIKLLKYTFP